MTKVDWVESKINWIDMPPQFMVQRFIFYTNLKILSGLEIDRAMIKGDHGLIINSNDH